MTTKTIEFVYRGDASQLEEALKGVVGGLEETGEAATKTGKEGASALQQLDKAADKAGKVMMGALAGGALAAGAAIAGIVTATIKGSEKLNIMAKRAKKVGEAVEDLQKVQGVFDLMTEGTVDAARAIQDFQRNMADARDGAGEATDELDKLGLSFKDIEGLTLPETMALVADRFDRLQDSAEQSGAAMAIFGRAGRELVPALNQGGDAVRDAAEQFEGAGVITATFTRSAEELQDQILLTNQALFVMRTEVLGPLQPVLAGTLKAVREMLSGFRETGALDDLGATVRRVFLETLLPAVAVVGEQFEKGMAGIRVSASAAAVGLKRLEIVGLSLAGRFQKAAAATAELGAMQAELDQDVAGFIGTQDEAAERWGTLVDKIREYTAAAEQAATATTGISTGPSGSGGASPAGGGGGGDGAPDGAIDALEEQRALNEEIFDLKVRQHQEILLQIEEEEAARLRALTNGLGATQQAMSGISSLVSAASRAAIAATDEESEERLEAMRAAWFAQQAVALTTAAINIPLSISQAAAAPWPAAIGFMVAAGLASGAALAGVIIETAGGPGFHVGGMVGPGDVAAYHVGGIAGIAQSFARPTSYQLQPDEVNARLLTGEGVVGREGMKSLGESGLRDLNRGGGTGGQTVVITRIGHRTTDVQTHESVRRRRGPLYDSIRGTQPKSGRFDPFVAA